MTSTRKNRLWLLTLLALPSFACATTAHYDYRSEPDPRKMEFVIGATDLIRVTVWKSPELSTEATVRPDGTITMPLIGDLVAAGRTPTQLKETIAERSAQFIKGEAAPVTVAVVAVNSYRFTVTGNFEHPGVFASKYFVTVNEAIALAGGVNKFGDRRNLVLVRTYAGKTHRIPINYDRIASADHPEENLALMSGDTLYAP